MRVGARVVHCMGHRGVVVAVEGACVAVVRFVNTTSRVLVRDLEEE
jgi:hypothetical protein